MQAVLNFVSRIVPGKPLKLAQKATSVPALEEMEGDWDFFQTLKQCAWNVPPMRRCFPMDEWYHNLDIVPNEIELKNVDDGNVLLLCRVIIGTKRNPTWPYIAFHKEMSKLAAGGDWILPQTGPFKETMQPIVSQIYQWMERVLTIDEVCHQFDHDNARFEYRIIRPS